MIIEKNSISKDFFWLNEPRYFIKDGTLTVITEPNTDFWQRTHYGFCRDNGHSLLGPQTADFSLTVETHFQPLQQYDQCGLMVRIDGENWIKTSMEFESPHHSRLGSVVTNLGYSDWATQDIWHSIHTLWYRIQSKNQLKDFLIEYSQDGQKWNQLRITHLLKESQRIQIGLYACSPQNSSFQAEFRNFHLGKSTWE